MSEWKEVLLSDFIKVKHGYAFKGEFITEQENNQILVTPGNFKIGGGFKSQKFKYYNDTAPDDYILTTGDVVVTMTDLSKETDTLGYSAKIPASDEKKFLHNQRVGLVQFISDQISKDFIYWLLRTKEYQWFIVGSSSGTSVMHTSPYRILEYQFNVPEFETQEKIAKVLTSIENKIDLLHRQNKTLEQMAETLFRQWFMEEVKEEWKEGVLGDLIEVKYGKDHKKFLDGNIPVYGSGGIMRFADTILYDSESVLVPRKGTLNNVIYINEPFWTVDTMFYTIMKKPNLAKFIYHFLNRQDLAAMNVGSAVPSMTTNILNCMPLLLPPEDVLEKFELTVTPYYSKIESNKKQIGTLENLRDTLLPKLMSGEVRVDDIDVQPQDFADQT